MLCISKSKLTLPPVLNLIVLLFGLDFIFVCSTCKAGCSIVLGIWASEILKISRTKTGLCCNSLIEQFWIWFMYWAWLATLNVLLKILHFVWSNDSIVSKYVYELVPFFEIFILHDGHWYSISVFLSMKPSSSLNKIWVHNSKLLLVF